MTRRRLGVGVVGFGWMGQAHSRSYRRIPALFPDRVADPVLVVCADALPARRTEAIEGFGFAEATDDWRKVVEHPDVDRFFEHGAFVPGRANGIGFEDLVTIEDHHFAAAVAEGRPFDPSFDAAVRYVNVQVQDAMLRSWQSSRWETVHDLRESP